MRRSLIVGNWKMNLNREEGVALARALVDGLGKLATAASVDVAVCPPSVWIDSVSQVLRGSPIAWGAQNMYFKASGAFTGEISAPMLVSLECRYVILGHSERRQFFGDTDALVFDKTKAALAAGLTPIVCVGESKQQREDGKTNAVIEQQFQGSLSGLTAEEIARCVIAYEPIWAIGTGLTATPAQAQAVHVDLRKLLEVRYNAQVASTVRIQYGGSVNAENASDLLSQADIDGALVGGASLKAKDFLSIVAAG